MTITITWQMVAWAIGLVSGWTGFLLAAIKWLLNRQITGLETRLSEAEKTAKTAAAAVSTHELSFIERLAALRLEFSTKVTCNNHSRMEGNDRELFKTMKTVQVLIGEVNGDMKGLRRSVDLLIEHHINGGK